MTRRTPLPSLRSCPFLSRKAGEVWTGSRVEVRYFSPGQAWVLVRPTSDGWLRIPIGQKFNEARLCLNRLIASSPDS
jgi:hypothetical protein